MSRVSERNRGRRLADVVNRRALTVVVLAFPLVAGAATAALSAGWLAPGDAPVAVAVPAYPAPPPVDVPPAVPPVPGEPPGATGPTSGGAGGGDPAPARRPTTGGATVRDDNGRAGDRGRDERGGKPRVRDNRADDRDDRGDRRGRGRGNGGNNGRDDNSGPGRGSGGDNSGRGGGAD